MSKLFASASRAGEPQHFNLYTKYEAYFPE